MGWCTVPPWSRSLLKLDKLGQFLSVPRNFEIFHDRLGSGKWNWGNHIRPEIWWHDAVYHEADHCMKWPHSANVRIFWFRPAEGAVVLWTSCLNFVHRARQWYCRALCKIANLIGQLKNGCYGCKNFREIWVLGSENFSESSSPEPEGFLCKVKHYLEQNIKSQC